MTLSILAGLSTGTEPGQVMPGIQSQAATPGQVITFFSAPGSVGRSTIALNIACELAVLGKRVLLIDADTSAPGLNVQLNLGDHPAGLAAACRLAAQDRLTLAEITRLSQRLELAGTAFSFMAGLSSPNRWPEVSAGRFESVIDVAKLGFEYVVIDTASAIDPQVADPTSGALRSQATLTALEAANIIIALALADPVGIHRFVAAFDQLRALGLSADLVVVVNRLRSSVIGPKPKLQITETLQRFANVDAAGFIHEDLPSLDRAVLEAAPLAMGSRKSPARQSIAQIVRTSILGESSLLDKRLAKLG